ncbi:MAG TPA: hypothetical protein VM123_15760 [archaeon]|nr:hypothetical protein [archaeon]
MRKSNITKRIWWGSFTFPENTGGKWRIGPATFWIERSIHEWRVAYKAVDELAENGAEVALPLQGPVEHGSGVAVTRFGMSKTTGNLTITPVLADRSVVIRPETPFYILPNQDVAFYVSSPLWVRIETGDPPVVLRDIPIFRPSDTWFGPSTMEGELCYADRVYGRLKLEDIKFRPHRAITVVFLQNQGSGSIFLERLNLPVPNLSIYEAEDGYLWTQAVTLKMGIGKKAELELKKKAPAAAKNPKLISGPRQKAEKSILSRALKNLII